MDEYADELVKVRRRLTIAMLEYFGLEPIALQRGLTKELDDYPGVAFALNYYPKCPRPDLVLGLFPHADAGALTVLHQNEVAGLQVLKDDKWVTVKPVKNALVVNISNQLEILTNGRLKGSKHLVVAGNIAPWISVAAFCNPGRPNVIVGPLSHLIDEMHPGLYTPVEFFKYLYAHITGRPRFKPLSSLDSSENGSQ